MPQAVKGQKRIPERTCTGCGEVKPKAELLRVVRSPEGALSVDATGRKPGRGAYVCRSAECLKKAIRQKQLERAFECALQDEVKEALMRELQALEENGGED